MVVCSSEGLLGLVDADNGALVRRLRGHRGLIAPASISDDGRLLPPPATRHGSAVVALGRAPARRSVALPPHHQTTLSSAPTATGWSSRSSIGTPRTHVGGLGHSEPRPGEAPQSGRRRYLRSLQRGRPAARSRQPAPYGTGLGDGDLEPVHGSVRRACRRDQQWRDQPRRPHARDGHRRRDDLWDIRTSRSSATPAGRGPKPHPRGVGRGAAWPKLGAPGRPAVGDV